MNRTVLAGIVSALFLAGCGDQAADHASPPPAPSVESAPAPETAQATGDATEAKPADAAAPAGAPGTADVTPEAPAAEAPTSHPLDLKPTALETTPSYTTEEAKHMVKELTKDAQEGIQDTAKK